MQGELENQPEHDDWGDFSAVISGLEETETNAVIDAPTEAANEEKPAGEMFEGALSVLFTIAEQATSIISGVDFEFDEKGKAAVIEAALPVLEKHGDTVTSMFGNYMEEAVLGLAVLSLVYSAKKTMTYQKELLAIEEKKQREQKKKTPLKFPNPVNSNPSHDAEHVIYVAGTGGGKTSAVKHLGLVPKAAQAVFFDPYRNYAGAKYRGQMCLETSSRVAFVKALVLARKRGKSFKLAYVPSEGACGDELEFFSAAVWAVGNGDADRLHVVIEELASCVETSGKLKGKAGELWRGGRQYGLVLHSIFQRGQEVPKTVTEQSPVWWIGAVNSMADARWLADKKGLCVDTLAGLKSAKNNKAAIGKPIAEYLLVRDGIGNVEKSSFNCLTGKIHG